MLLLAMCVACESNNLQLLLQAAKAASSSCFCEAKASPDDTRKLRQCECAESATRFHSFLPSESRSLLLIGPVCVWGSPNVEQPAYALS